MKKETLQYANITVVEYWNPSVQLRFVKRKVSDFSNQIVGGAHLKKEVNILQQLHTSNLGNIEWKDVPTETES
mgnify:FL=1